MAALRTGIRAIVTILLAGALWLATGWEGGGPMVMACAIMCSIFATHPVPARGVRSSLAGAALAFVAALLVRGVLLPAGTGVLPAIAILGGLAAITVGRALSRLHALEHGGTLPSTAVVALARARRAIGAISLDPGRAAAIVRETAARLERLSGDYAGALEPELARARLALVEIAEALDANPRFFGIAG